MATFFCVKCREKKEVDDSQVKHITTKNGRPAITAPCPDCGTRMFKFVK